MLDNRRQVIIYFYWRGIDFALIVHFITCIASALASIHAFNCTHQLNYYGFYLHFLDICLNNVFLF